jgi:hypothetical protein
MPSDAACRSVHLSPYVHLLCQTVWFGVRTDMRPDYVGPIRRCEIPTSGEWLGVVVDSGRDF